MLTKYPLTVKWLRLWYFQELTERMEEEARNARSQLTEKQFWDLSDVRAK